MRGFEVQSVEHTDISLDGFIREINVQTFMGLRVSRVLCR